ncbi:13022_t:CDS:2, partial [Gigaspora margarita]
MGSPGSCRGLPIDDGILHFWSVRAMTCINYEHTFVLRRWYSVLGFVHGHCKALKLVTKDLKTETIPQRGSMMRVK